MIPFVLPLYNEKDLGLELESIKADKAGFNIMYPKACFRAVKVKGLKTIAANILKQEMLSRGGDVVVGYGAINNSAKTTDVLILGTLAQFKDFLLKLKQHQFGLPQLSLEIKQVLDNAGKKSFVLRCKNKKLLLGKQTRIMGILNITPDSFSNGGKFFDLDLAVEQGLKMAEAGADIIDVGGESTRPGAKTVSVKEELARVIPVIKKLSKVLPKQVIISIDTRRSKVAKSAVANGADMVNDVSGLCFDPKMAHTVAKSKAGLCLMHMQGRPGSMQKNPKYNDLMAEIIEYLDKAVKKALLAGISKDRIMIDPGIGFGKTVEHNFKILRRLGTLRSLGFPVLVGTSRKSFIGKVLNSGTADRIEGTAATVALSIANGANIVRVHDVLEMAKVARVIDAIQQSK